MSWDSSVSEVSDYGLDDKGLFLFATVVKSTLEPIQTAVPWRLGGSFSKGKAARV